MSSGDEPVRLIDDPGAPGELRAALARAASTPAVAYDTSRGLERFRAQLASSATSPPAPSASHGGAWLRARWWGLGAVGVAALVAALVGARALTGHADRAASAGDRALDAPTYGHAIEHGAATTTAGPAAAIAPVAGPNPMPAEIARPAGDDALSDRRTDPAAHFRATAALRGRGDGLAPARLASAQRAGADARGAHHGVAFDAGVAASLDMLRAGRESQQLEWANGVLESDPARALALADEGDRDFPSSPRREERDALAVRALVRLRRWTDARSRATGFLARWPRGAWSAMVRQLLVQSEYASRAR